MKRESGGVSHYDYGFRIYNPSIARFLSVDPLTRSYPMLPPYQFASNTPINSIDIDGLENRSSIRQVTTRRSPLRIVRGNGKVINLRPNPNFNPNNPSALAPPFIEDVEPDCIGDIPTTGSIRQTGTFEVAIDATDPLAPIFERAKSEAAFQAQLDGTPDDEIERLMDLEDRGGLLTAEQQRLIHEYLNSGKRTTVHRNSKASNEPQELYRISVERTGEIVYIGVGTEGQNRPEESLRNASEYPELRGEKLGVEIFERPPNRNDGLRRENEELEEHKRIYRQYPRLNGKLYSRENLNRRRNERKNQQRKNQQRE